jgi:hypothetical protein
VSKVFFASRRFPFHLVIYPGSGPGFAHGYGWPVEPIDNIASAEFDIAIVENRLVEDDIAVLESFFAGRGRKMPVFFKMSDPEMPRSRDPGVRYILGKADAPGVHYLSVYRPAGPLADFFAGLRRSQVVTAPFPYEAEREVDTPIAGRARRVFLSGARHRRVYPFRESLYRRVAWNPLARRLVDRLAHPGYPDTGKQARHDIVRERYVARAAASTHFFLDPSRYGVELMKYLECAYAGSVPIGALPAMLPQAAVEPFIVSACRTADLRRALSMPMDDMEAMAAAYRRAMRAARDARTLDVALDGQIDAAL